MLDAGCQTLYAVEFHLCMCVCVRVRVYVLNIYTHTHKHTHTHTQELRATDGVIGAAMWALSTVFFVWVCSPLLAGYAGELAAAARGVSGVGSRKKKKTARRLSGAQQRQVWLVVIHS